MSAMAKMTVGKHRVKCRHACVLQTVGCCLPWGVSVACFIALERSCSICLSRGKGLLFWVRIFPQQHLEVPSLVVTVEERRPLLVFCSLRREHRKQFLNSVFVSVI